MVPGLDLHQFTWLKEGQSIGSLPIEYNWLVGEYEPNHQAKIYHYTRGTPCFWEYADCDHADVWFEEKASMTAAAQRPCYVPNVSNWVESIDATPRQSKISSK